MSVSTIKLGDFVVQRLGFGAMRLPGKDVWGEPDDPAAARALCKRVVELGINFIDSSWYYGPHVANRLIREALHPYARDSALLPGESFVTPDGKIAIRTLATSHAGADVEVVVAP
jgi:aryl-alcohol dehydrogenase-like predicted oxidoreductase